MINIIANISSVRQGGGISPISIVTAYQERVEAAGGVFEGEECMIIIIQDLRNIEVE